MPSHKQEQERHLQMIKSAIGDADVAKKVNHGLLSYVDITLSAAELDALAATAKEVIPAPGAGKVLIFKGAFVYYDYVSAAYAGSSQTITFKYDSGDGATVGTITEAFIESTADAYQWVEPVTAVALVNKNIAVKASADLTTGDGNMKIRAYYQVVDADLSDV